MEARCVVEPLDLPRPLSAAELLAALPAGPGRILLESGLAEASLAGGTGTPAPGAARWSFAMAEPLAVLSGSDRRFQLRAGPTVLDQDTDPFTLLDRTLLQLGGRPLAEPDRRPPGRTGGPPFCGGLAGVFTYDLNRHAERLPQRPRPGLPIPDLFLGVYELVAALDHATGTVWLAAWFRPEREGEVRQRWRRWERAIRQAAAGEPAPGPVPPPPGGPIHEDIPRDDYGRRVQRVRDYIAAGDVFQVNLSRRFTAPIERVEGASTPGWDIFARLRAANPAPFSAYIHGPAFEVASASPERFLAVEPQPDGWRVETRPIKGTRPRGSSPAQDGALAQELLSSAKDRAELTMIVDLCRNDIGRVARYGSVRVADLRRLESFPTVHHTVATVEGRLRPGVSVGQLLRATFPAGSITGAPKVRAMEIIDELEPVRRQVFCGSIGYVGLDGRLDLSVAIRTVTVAGGRAAFHAGGGVVADSDPAREVDETVVKARALMAAVSGEPAPGRWGEVAACTPG